MHGSYRELIGLMVFFTFFSPITVLIAISIPLVFIGFVSRNIKLALRFPSAKIVWLIFPFALVPAILMVGHLYAAQSYRSLAELGRPPASPISAYVMGMLVGNLALDAFLIWYLKGERLLSCIICTIQVLFAAGAAWAAIFEIEGFWF
jgi:hypothetical protein